MLIYLCTLKYRLLSMYGIISACLMVLIGSISGFYRLYTEFIILFLPGVLLLYLPFLVFPEEIQVDEDGVMFRTKLRRIYIKYYEIKEIKPQYTTRTLTMTGGDKEKAAVYYSIRIKNRPMTLLLFGSGILSYRKFYEHLKNKIQV